jgi:ceramide glucosyltransferase
VWAPPVETSTATAADRASRAVLTASLHAFAVLALLDPGGMVGKVMALRRSSLERVGGFASLLRHLGEDMELARRFRADGFRVCATTEVARSLATRPHLADTVERLARWLTVIRLQRPVLLASYPLLFAPTAPMLVATALIGASSPALAAAVATLVVATRVAGVLLARVASNQPLAPWTAVSDAVRADGVLLLAWTRALTRKTVQWRGGELSFDRDGLLAARTIASR